MRKMPQHQGEEIYRQEREREREEKEKKSEKNAGFLNANKLGRSRGRGRMRRWVFEGLLSLPRTTTGGGGECKSCQITPFVNN